ncbi:MAG: Hsp70 family protein [Actinomycetia bacterium]|nr:Hsp70 family protein [Actinomycetes bacterium]
MERHIDLGVEELSQFQPIGEGGFSTVYVAWDEGFHRQVAVKVLRNIDADGRRRFDRERAIMGRLSSHPNVITPFQAGYTPAGSPFLVMEFVPNGSLDDLLEARGRVPWREAVEYLIPVVSALGHAHEQGILHRDVKPGNILLAAEGPKLTDFGIAAIRQSTATQIGYTLAHCPPETFADGRDVRDERSDLYSVASTLHTLIAGHPPFHVADGDSQPAYLVRILDGDPPPLSTLIPPGLQQLLDSALAKDPDQRPQSAAQFVTALERQRDAVPGSASAPTVVAIETEAQGASGYTTILANEQGGSSSGEETVVAEQAAKPSVPANPVSEMVPTSYAVGIDLGTSRSLIAVRGDDGTIVIPGAEGLTATPSVVGLGNDKLVLVGDAAERRAVSHPDRTIRSIKRGIDGPVALDGRDVWPQEVNARLLRKLKHDAETYLGELVTEVVIGVPVSFGHAQRVATIEAATIAGLKVLRIVDDTVLAALAIGFGDEDDETALVVDLGAGFLSASVVEMGDGVFEIKASVGDGGLGGDDWDRAIIDWLVDQLPSDARGQVESDPVAAERLRQVAKQAKEDLSSAQSTTAQVPYLAQVGEVPHHLDIELTRSRFEELTADLLRGVRSLLEGVMADVPVSPSDIDRVALLGGASRMPAVRQAVAELTGRDEVRVESDETVVAGAAIQHGVLAGNIKDVLLLDVTAFALGVEVIGSVMQVLIARNTSVPTRKALTLTNSIDDQVAMEINVFQGDRDLATENTWLGTLEIAPLPPGPAGTVQVDTFLDVDANEVITVTATERSSQRQHSMTLGPTGELTGEQLSWMRAETSQDLLDLTARPPDLAPREARAARSGPRSTDFDRSRNLPRSDDPSP